jgi:uncharacterized OB-fold protein
MAKTESKSHLPHGLPVPRPTPDGLDRGFWEGASRHEVVVQRCNKCGALQFPPEWLCHKCQSLDLGWQKLSGRGQIFSWERVWHPVHPALKSSCPYLVVVVQLVDANGARMVGNLLGDPGQEVHIGAEVEAVFEDHPEQEFTLIQWRAR